MKAVEKDTDRQCFRGQLSRCERHRAFEVAAAPAHTHDRASIGKCAVLEVERSARALQQGLGDEKAKPKPARLAVQVLPPAVCDIGLANAVHNLGSEARTIVGDTDVDILTWPGRSELAQLRARIDRVVAQDT